MIPVRVFHYREPAAAILGFTELAKRGITPRGILFMAVDPRGELHLAIPDELARMASIRVGDKLTAIPPWEGRYFHFDAIHRLPGETVLWNGDRRLGDTGVAAEIACGFAGWLQRLNCRNVFLGCTPHQPGSWWVENDRAAEQDLHASGIVDAVVTQEGIIARRIGEPGLFHRDFATLRREGVRGKWEEIYRSHLGNILMVERRIINYSVVLSCQRGLIELDISGAPEQIVEIQHANNHGLGIGVVGRIDGGAFAVCQGDAEEWGFTKEKPASLIGNQAQSLQALCDRLAADS